MNDGASWERRPGRGASCSGLRETDPQEWSLAKLQRSIVETKCLLARMDGDLDPETTELRALIEGELRRKKDMLSRLWARASSR